MSDLLCKLNSLALMRDVCSREPVASMRRFLELQKSGADQAGLISAYSEFVASIYKIRSDGNLSLEIRDIVFDNENAYLFEKITEAKVRMSNAASKYPIDNVLVNNAEAELQIMNDLASVQPKYFTDMISGYNGYLPGFHTVNVDISEEYHDMLSNIVKTGYGIFRRYLMFRVSGGEIMPVKTPDPISVDKLYNYELQRNQVISNTQAFIEGRTAADALLYGDAGTGKSSTIKAVARLFEKDGLRLVELPKSELSCLPHIIEVLSASPMKFIVFIDDVSFEADDDRIGMLKSVLEGAAMGGRENILIYATSNRRHMIKESYADRTDEVHLNDTMAETMSLSERFGLKVSFSNPNKQVYLDIVHKLCENKIPEALQDKSLDVKAESFADRHGGRSARCACQFVNSLGV